MSIYNLTLFTVVLIFVAPTIIFWVTKHCRRCFKIFRDFELFSVMCINALIIRLSCCFGFFKEYGYENCRNDDCVE